MRNFTTAFFFCLILIDNRKKSSRVHDNHFPHLSVLKLFILKVCSPWFYWCSRPCWTLVRTTVWRKQRRQLAVALPPELWQGLHTSSALDRRRCTSASSWLRVLMIGTRQPEELCRSVSSLFVLQEDGFRKCLCMQRNSHLKETFKRFSNHLFY